MDGAKSEKQLSGNKTGKPGRPKGTPNKATIKRQAEIAASGLTPLDYMLQILRDEKSDIETRMDAAKSAAPYVHPKLATIAHTGPDGGALLVQIVRLADAND